MNERPIFSKHPSFLARLRHHWKKLAGLMLLGVLILLMGAVQVARSRSFQFFGEIVARVETDKKWVALSFDDGPTTAATEQVLAMLADAGVKASFFVTGKELRQRPELGKRIVDAGHELGNHSYNHQRMLLMSYGEVAWEVARTQELIREAGQQEPIYFRPPYGKKWVNLPLYLSVSDITTVTWDVAPDSDRAISQDSQRIVDETLASVRPGSIILLHVMYPSRQASLAAVPGIIQGLRAKGYEIVTVGKLLQLRA